MGSKDNKLNPSKLRFTIMISFLILMVIVVYNLEPDLEVARKNREISYDKIVNNTDEYIGKDFKISGEIIDMVSRDNECSITLSVVLTREQSLNIDKEYTRTSNNQAKVKLIYKTPEENYMNFNIHDRVEVSGKIVKVITVNNLRVPVVSSDNIYDIEII